jgi:hypothetical protein
VFELSKTVSAVDLAAIGTGSKYYSIKEDEMGRTCSPFGDIRMTYKI